MAINVLCDHHMRQVLVARAIPLLERYIEDDGKMLANTYIVRIITRIITDAELKINTGVLKRGVEKESTQLPRATDGVYTVLPATST